MKYIVYLFFLVWANDAIAKESRPNIIYIYADDLGYGELGCYGQQKIATPNIDKLAREGMRFSRHYSSAPVCAPSRCMLLTGKPVSYTHLDVYKRQSIDSFSIQTISEVVVTGSITPQSARQSVYQIRSIGQDQIKLRGAVRIQDVLATETNIRFNQDLATGNSNMSMQGIAGQNVKILIDGIPMVGRQGTNNEINLNQIDINTIARIEVVEGPMSVIYGADALAGVINIITKKAIEGKADLAIKIQEETVHTEYGWPAGIHQYAINGGFSKGDVYIKGNLARNGFGGYTGTAIGRDYQWHPKTQYLTGMVLGIDKNRFKSHYRLDYTNEDIFNPGIPTSSIANDQNYLTSRWMHQWQSDVHLSDKLKLNTAIGYTHFKRQVQATTSVSYTHL